MRFKFSRIIYDRQPKTFKLLFRNLDFSQQDYFYVKIKNGKIKPTLIPNWLLESQLQQDFGIFEKEDIQREKEELKAMLNQFTKTEAFKEIIQKMLYFIDRLEQLNSDTDFNLKNITELQKDRDGFTCSFSIENYPFKFSFQNSSGYSFWVRTYLDKEPFSYVSYQKEIECAETFFKSTFQENILEKIKKDPNSRIKLLFLAKQKTK